MTKFTKEQLIEWAKGGRMLAQCAVDARPDDAAAVKNLALAEIALAALTAPTEPVYQYRIRNAYNGQVTEWQTIRRDQVDFVLKAQPLNAEFQIIAPPAPVVPDEWRLQDAIDFIEKYTPPSEEEAALFAWNACRAAMLQGAEPVRQSYTLPDGYCVMPSS